MVHYRLNERETHPNVHINFISALPMPGSEPPYSEEDAKQLLRALAAQVRPVMKSHGLGVNSFEEYEFNPVFAGRNWNAGEVIELVLRRADSTFVPIPWLLSTLCHELAHIKYMNHGRDFQKLWAQLRNEVTALRDRGYFGDGYWSSGTRLSDSSREGGDGIGDYDLPEYVCGGAQTRTRPKSLGRRRRRRQPVAGPSNHTGRQTEKRRKPGARVQAKGKFLGEGTALNAGISDEAKSKGTGFRKSASSKRAREERALAAEKRLKLLEGFSKTSGRIDEETETESDDDNEDPFMEHEKEDDDARRRTMKETMKDDELEYMRQFMKEFITEANSGIAFGDPSSSRKPRSICDIPLTSNPVSGGGLGLKNMVDEERKIRKRESLGLTDSRTLGSSRSESDEGVQWSCQACTFVNITRHLACSVCATPRGEGWLELKS